MQQGLRSRLDKTTRRQVLLASIYLDIKKPVAQTWLEDLVNMADKRRLPLILGIDSNAHSSLYGPDNNSRGDAFEDWITKHGLEIANEGNTPTYETRRGNQMIATHIDVTLTRDLHFDIQHWRVDQSYNASDHNTIRFEASPTKIDNEAFRPWASADWHLH